MTITAHTRDLLFVGLGDLVGGGLLVGAAYVLFARPAEAAGSRAAAVSSSASRTRT
ncbi:hypothetical protein [Streptomyces bauhiniae]|uniref:Uncharacterized protein n=1 Tax=Streptomyces bauhiniae TaxID=2340725 RepID=A0A7K3QKI0_9ACTN|nr:hypothetical protein [Streptomyces bauhiniae]NEB90398.1 hypothetical protein [Streptomyces bauhiniae]